MTPSIRKPALALLGLVVAAGLATYALQLASGLGLTGMNNSTSWGLYLTCFMFFVGLSAGGLIVAASASIFRIERYKQVALPAVICSLVCICCAGICVLVDLGGIGRLWRIVTGMNLRSPLAWDICVITTYLIINVLDLRFLVKGDERSIDRLSRFALPIAILVHSVTAWIFGLQIAKEAWHSAILAPIFVASALDSGLAVLLLALFALRRSGRFHTEDSLISNLAGLLCVCVSVDFYLIFCEILTTAYAGTDAGNAVLGTLLAGGTAPFFWFEVVFGLALPFALLAFRGNRANMRVVGIASALIVAGVFCKRCWLMFTAFAHPALETGNGITLGTRDAQLGGAREMWSAVGSYAPTAPEIIITVAIFALGILAFILLCDRFLSKAR